MQTAQYAFQCASGQKPAINYCPTCFNICTIMLMLKLTFQLIQTHDHPCNYVQLTCTSVDYTCISCSNMVIFFIVVTCILITQNSFLPINALFIKHTKC